MRSHTRKAYLRADGTRVSGSFVEGHCKADPPQVLKWRDRLTDVRIASPWLKREQRKKWSEEERERVLDALLDLPPFLVMDSVSAIYRARQFPGDPNNPAAGDPGIIALYDSAFSESQNLTRILAHEFAHELFRQMDDVARVSYASAAGWTMIRGSKPSDRRFVLLRFDVVEEDSRDRVTEDFANNLEYALFSPKSLAQKAPGALSWLQKTFGDTLKLRPGSRP